MNILVIRIDFLDYAEVVQKIFEWCLSDNSRYICAENVHMVMETHNSAEFRTVVNRADLVTPDGMPLVWRLRWKLHTCMVQFSIDACVFEIPAKVKLTTANV